MRSGSHVLVIGAGIVGAAAAYYLAQAGVKVTVVDAEHPAWGASGRNAGYLWLHTRAQGVQMELALAGRRLYDELAEQLDDFEFRPGGGMIYFFGHQSSLFPAFVENRRAAGLPMQLLDPQEARDICPILPEHLGGATYNPLDGHVNPEKVTRSLLAGAERAGATFRPGTRVLGLDVAGGRCHGVWTQDGGIGAGVVVVAAGVWSPTLLEPLGLTLPIVPMRLQVAETAHAPVRIAPVLYGPTDRAVTAVAAQHRRASQGQHGYQGIALAPRLPWVRNLC